MKYLRPEAGEWVQPVLRGYKLACCDCGLVHKMDFRVKKGKPQFRVFLDKRATAAMRTWKAKRFLNTAGFAMKTLEDVVVKTSEKEREVARMVRDHQKIIDTKRKSCPRCYGTGAVDAPTSADDPSCPDCDGEGNE